MKTRAYTMTMTKTMMLTITTLLCAVGAFAQTATNVVTSSTVAVQQTGWLGALIAIINSPATLSLIGALVAWGVAHLFTKKPEWKKYEGLLITAVNAAEKLAIPEGTANGSKLKAKAALDAFVDQYTNHYGQPPTDKIVDVAKASLPIIHDAMTARGTL